jgi:AcrR family transcriptional regulator
MTSAGQASQIMSVARQQLAEAGAHGLSLGAVASSSGLSIVEIETIFEHRDSLLTALIIDAYNASGAAMEAADRAALDDGAGPGARLLAVARALRAWSIANPGEFALLYGSPVPGYHAPQDTVGPAARTPAVLAGIVRAALETGALVPPQRAIPGPPLILPAAIELFGGVPGEPFRDLLERGIVLWSNLIGLLIFERFGRNHDSIRDPAAFFSYGIAVAAESIGLAVPRSDQ